MSTQDPRLPAADGAAPSSREPAGRVSGSTIAIWTFVVVEAIAIGGALFSTL